MIEMLKILKLMYAIYLQQIGTEISAYLWYFTWSYK